MMDSTRYRPRTAGPLSTRTHAASHGDDAEDSEPTHSEPTHPPTRPSTQRSTRSPRTEILGSGEGRMPTSGRGNLGADEESRRELATLRQKLAENDIAKARAQVGADRRTLQVQYQYYLALC